MKLAYDIHFEDLNSSKGNSKIDQLFLQFLLENNPIIYDQLISARTSPGSISKIDYSNLLIQCAPFLDDFLSMLFDIEAENHQLKIKQKEFDIIYECKRKFVIRYALKKYDKAASELFDFEEISKKLKGSVRIIPKPISNWTNEFKSEGAERIKIREHTRDLQNSFGSFEMGNGITEKDLALSILSWQSDPEKNAENLDLAARYCAYMVYHNSNLSLFDVPRKVLENTPLRLHKIEQLKQHQPLGFSYRDNQQTLEKAMMEAKYCIYCHSQDKDYCSKGLPNEPEKSGCPLEQKISEMNKVKDMGFNLAALAIIIIDNPLVAITGHRICNDCMKSCIYQKQDPVNVPIIESNILESVLGFSWGVEIYLLLTKWNPLNIFAPSSKEKTCYNVLVAGLGPAACALSHYLLQEGHNIVAIDGLKITPLDHNLLKPIKNWSEVKVDLAGRMPQGFGGVAEYGITNRWDKNYLTLIRLMLERRENFKLYSGIRLGSNITIDQAFASGFDHVALCLGAGKPKFMRGADFFVKGVKSAADFLMALSQGGAFLPGSNTKLQVRLPALVIGCGLTAIDSAVEIVHYYQAQVENYLSLWEDRLCHPCEGSSQLRHPRSVSQLRHPRSVSQLRHPREGGDPESLAHNEFRDHALLLRKANSDTEKLKVLQDLGLVTICYRGKINDSPAYKRNHEEIEHAMALGIKFMEDMVPEEIIKDESGACHSIRFTNGHILPAKTILVAIGTNANEFLDLTHPELTSESNGISRFGDCDPAYAGSVVKALASAKNGYKAITSKLLQHKPKHNTEFHDLLENLNEQLFATIKKVEILPGEMTKLTIHSHMAAENFLPGQFFRMQNYAKNIKESLKPLAVSPAIVDKSSGLLTFFIKNVGASTKLCKEFKENEQILLMGPTGRAIEIAENKKTLLIGNGASNFTLLPIAKALREKGSFVTLLASHEKYNDEELIRGEVDRLICSDDYLRHSRESGNSWISAICARDDIRDNLATYDQVICNLPCDLAAEIKEKSQKLFGEAEVIFYLNAPMGCMMKGICGQCISKVNNPDGYVFACAETNQSSENIDFAAIKARLEENVI